MSVQAGDIVDLVTSTLPDLPKLKFRAIAQSLQNYPVMSEWLKKDRVVFDSGTSIRDVLWHKTLGAAKHTDLMEPDDDLSIGDVLKNIDIPWRQAQTKWSVGYHETLYNRGKALIVKIIEPRRLSAMLDLAQELEDKAWVTTASGATKTPWSVPYWIVWNSSTGFNGGVPFGSTIAGISLTDVPNFKNYTFQYTDVTRTDWVRETRRAFAKMRWRPPIDYGNAQPEAPKYKIYVNLATELLIRERAEDQNENLGPDVDSMNGKAVFNKVDIVYVPKLDDYSQDPTYFIDHSVFYVGVLKGDYLRETTKPAPRQHNWANTWIDLSYNYVCCDRRRCGVAAKTGFAP